MTEEYVKLELGRRVREARKERGKTQAQLARAIRCPRPSLVNIEKGNANLTVWRLLQICTALDVSPDSFMRK